MQEVIVYRNPAEAALWHAMQGGEFFLVIAGVVVFFIVFLTLNAVFVRRWGSWGKGASTRTNIALVVGALSGILTVWKMWI